MSNEARAHHKWLRQKDLVERTGLTGHFWERARWDNSGPPVTKMGRAVLYREDLFEAWMAERTPAAPGLAKAEKDKPWRLP